MRMSCYWSWIAHNIVKVAVDPRGDTRVVWIRRLLLQCYKTDSVIVKLLISPFRANLWLNGVFSCNLIAFRFCTLCNFWERMSLPRFWFEGSHDHAPGEILYRLKVWLAVESMLHTISKFVKNTYSTTTVFSTLLNEFENGFSWSAFRAHYVNHKNKLEDFILTLHELHDMSCMNCMSYLSASSNEQRRACWRPR